MALSRHWIVRSLACRCPRCGIGALFEGYLKPVAACSHCGLEIARNDSGDGPAVFLIFILGFLVVPAALIVEFTWSPPIWVHVIAWPLLIGGLIALLLRPSKSLVIAIQYRNRPADFG